MSVQFHQVLGVAVVLGFVGPALAQGQCQSGKQGGPGTSASTKMSSTRMQGGPPNMRIPFNPPGQRTPFIPITSQRQIPLQTPLGPPPQLQMQIMLQQQLQQQQFNQALLNQQFQLMQGVQAHKLAASQTDATLQHASAAHPNILVRQAAVQEMARRLRDNGHAVAP